jgi:predicted phosphodiesterase
MTAVALISDIHANLPALEAVVKDLRARRPDTVYVLGDLVNGCPWPDEVLDLLGAQGWPMLLGNHDDAVLQLGTPRMEPRYANRSRFPTLWWTRERMAPAHLDALAALPLEFGLSFPDAPSVRLIHGLPGNFFVGFRPDSPESWAAQHLAGVAEGVVAGGHTHVAMVRHIHGPEREWLVVNSGSVGGPYDGDPRAGYAWLEGSPAGWRVEVRRVDYDRCAVEAGYRASGLLDEGGPIAALVLRTILDGLPWISDFAYWLRDQPADQQADMGHALARYETAHGPGRWAFPL